MMNIKKLLLLSFALFLLMGFACAENPVEADGGFKVSNSAEFQLNCSFSNDYDGLSSQSGLGEADAVVLSETRVVDDGTFSGIEDAISASNPGDTIYLGNKRYVGDGSAIHVDKNHLKFVGESKSNKATLDARGLGRIFNVKQATDITFKNIRFINGKYENEGSGIVSFGTVHIEDCEFINNAGDSGTCIFLSQDADGSTIINCTFTNNKALYGWDGWAEGAAIDSHVSNTRILDCTFKNNFAVNSGGAIALRNGKNNIIRNCIFTSNTSPIAGALYLKNTTAQITGSIFNLNHGSDNRGGALAISDSSVILDGSSFISNSADYGGAIYNFPGSELTVKNSNFIKNNADNGGCIYSSGELSINNSNFTSNECKNGKAIIYCTKSSKITYSTFTSNSRDTDSYLLYLNCNKNIISNNNFESNQKATYALNDNEISFNIFKDNKNGLILKNNNKIYSNIFLGNDIAVDSGNNNQIYFNAFENNKHAIDSDDNNRIYSNVFSENTFGINSGNNNEISFNNFSNNEKSLFSNNKNNILNNTFKNNEIGIVLNDNNILSFNGFYNNSLALKGLKSNKINNSTFSYNEKSAQLAGSSNELFDNSFSCNTIGIQLFKSDNNIIKFNSFSSNYQNSIKGTGFRNQLKGNNFTNNGLSGKYCNVYIRGNENKAIDNIFKNNKYHALHFNGNKTIIQNNVFKDTGNISLRVNGNHIKIKNNRFTGNKNTQMQVFGNNNQIYKNIIKNGHDKGISIYGNHNKVVKNKIKSNKLIGIYVNGNRNNLTKNNVTGSKKGIFIHGDKNIVFKCNIKKNNNIGTHILGNNNQISKNNITKSNKGLFIHGNQNNILQNVIKGNKMGVHNYKSKNNKINYNYIVSEKHNLYGNGCIDADYNWWGKNKRFKVSKSLKIKKFVVMYLSAPHTLKINKTYQIRIIFKDNEDKKLKLSIPSLSTKHYFNDYIKTNKSNIKNNNLKTSIKVIKKRNNYELKIVCDGQTLVKNYYFNNGKVTDKQARSNAEYELLKSFYDFFKLYDKYQKDYGNHKSKNSTFSPREDSDFYHNLNRLGKKIESFSNNKLIMWNPGLRGITYTVGRLIRNIGGSRGDIWSFFSRPFLTIPNYSRLDHMQGGKLIKALAYGLFDIDENGNLSTGDFLFNVVCLVLTVFTGGASILPKLRKIKSFSKIEYKIFGFIRKSRPYKYLSKNWNKLSNVFGKVGFVYEMISNPIRTSVVKILSVFSEDFKTFKLTKGYYDNFLTFIKDYTFGFTTFKNNALFLNKRIFSQPKKKSEGNKVNTYIKKHPEKLYVAAKTAQKIVFPSYKGKRNKNKNTLPKKHSTRNILYKGLNFIKNKILKNS